MYSMVISNSQPTAVSYVQLPSAALVWTCRRQVRLDLACIAKCVPYTECRIFQVPSCVLSCVLCATLWDVHSMLPVWCRAVPGAIACAVMYTDCRVPCAVLSATMAASQPCGHRLQPQACRTCGRVVCAAIKVQPFSLPLNLENHQMPRAHTHQYCAVRAGIGGLSQAQYIKQSALECKFLSVSQPGKLHLRPRDIEGPHPSVVRVPTLPAHILAIYLEIVCLLALVSALAPPLLIV